MKPLLKQGSILALNGPLGAGKTCFVKGVARALNVDEEITSATYTIVSEYEAPLFEGKPASIPVYHIDAYRLRNEDDFLAIGGEEILSGSGISLIEWGDRIHSLIPDGSLLVDITIQEDESRLIHVYAKEPA